MRWTCRYPASSSRTPNVAAASLADSRSWAKTAAVIAATGVILTAAYILWMIQRVYLGKLREEYAQYPDATARETAILIPMAALAIFMGIMPQCVFGLMNGSLAALFDVVKAAGSSVAMVVGG